MQECMTVTRKDVQQIVMQLQKQTGLNFKLEFFNISRIEWYLNDVISR